MGKIKIEKLKTGFINMKNSGQLRNTLLFTVFVAIAALFWMIMALNDNVQDGFDVAVRFQNVPDSVTFITDPPARIHVTARDKGTALLRHGKFQTPVLNLDFKTFSADGRFRFTRSDLQAALKQVFGGNATISSVSVDSICFNYTTSPGRRVPVTFNYNVTASPGKVVLPNPETNHRTVLVYGMGNSADTVRSLTTELITLRDLENTTTVTTSIKPIRGVRIKPSKIDVTFRVDPLVKKESFVAVTPDHVPSGRDILFFPAQVKVTYYVPMSRFNETEDRISVQASYRSAEESHTDKVGVQIIHMPPHVRNASLSMDSVEYTIVKL